jgi:hypothetical protein
MMIYKADYPKGTLVKIASLRDLQEFRESWRFHHPIQPEQLTHADQISLVNSISFYHGGDVLYQLEGIPGTWHQCCLQAAPSN